MFTEYCIGLADGAYFDPWHSICGYIQCTKGNAQRRHCAPGTWMGAKKTVYMGNVNMCRKPIDELAYFVSKIKGINIDIVGRIMIDWDALFMILIPVVDKVCDSFFIGLYIICYVLHACLPSNKVWYIL